MLNNWLIGICLNTGLGAIALALPKKVLTTMGIIHAWALGILVWGFLGWQGYGVILFYLVIGSSVTRIGKEIKEVRGIAEKRDGARGPENLWGSAFTAAVCAIGYGIFPHTLWQLGYVASLSTKLADTTASEVGKAYGKTTYLITTLQAVPNGTEGAISLEGTIAGVIGSIAQALIGYGLGLITSPMELGLCITAAFIATNIESLIGAIWQSKYAWLTNEVVNGIMGVIGAVAAVGGAILLRWNGQF